MFTPKMRGYAVHLLGLQENYKSLYSQERLRTSFSDGIDRQVLSALKKLHNTRPDIVSFIVDALDWYDYMRTKEKLTVIAPTAVVSPQTVFQYIIKYQPAIVSYLVDRLKLTSTFDSLFQNTHTIVRLLLELKRSFSSKLENCKTQRQ